MTAWQILSGVLTAPVALQLILWIRSLTGARAKARAKTLDAAAKIEAGKAQQLADLHAEIRSHRVTRDAEILALAVECAKLREDVEHHSEKAQAFELQAVRDRGTIQRVSEENERLKRELADCRRMTRQSDPFRGG